MKSMFSMSPFQGPQFQPAFARSGPVPGSVQWLGQAAPATTPPPTTTPSDADILGLNSSIESLLNQLPPETMGAYRERWNGCKKQISDGGLIGLGLGGQCLYKLFEDMKKAMTGVKPATPLPYMAPAPSSFPILPVAIAGIGGLMLIYGLTRL